MAESGAFGKAGGGVPHGDHTVRDDLADDGGTDA
jgi:hypothetical protein